MLKVNRQIDYGLILLKALKRSSQPLPLRTIAANYNLPYKFLTKIAVSFKHAGIIKSTEGSKGGYQLAKQSEEISLRDIFHALEAKKRLVHCLRSEYRGCRLQEICPMAPWWHSFDKKLEKLIQSIRLSDL